MKTKDPHLVIVGSANIDLTFRTGQLPRPGETLAGLGFSQSFGGKGANQAVMAARLGAHVTMVGRVGKDPFGLQMADYFQSQGIDTSFLLVDEQQPTGTAAIMVDDRGQNCIIVVPGANGTLTPADVRAAGGVIRKAAVLLCQLEVPLECTQEAFRLAREAGVPTILNPAPAKPLSSELLQLTDLCVPNESEVESLTGQPVTNLEQAKGACKKLGVPRLIVTLGEKGIFLVEENSAEHIPTRAMAAVDTTGAGDAFLGGLAVFWSQGLPLREAARRANAVAALSVTRPGTQTSFPTLQEVESFLSP